MVSLSPRRRRAGAALWRAAKAEGTSGERAGERGRSAKSKPPLPGPLLPPTSGGEGEAAGVRCRGSRRESWFGEFSPRPHPLGLTLPTSLPPFLLLKQLPHEGHRLELL